MQVYLDTSALMKLVVLEPETSALRTYLTQYPDDVRFTAALSRTELLRAARRSGSYELAAQAHRLLGRLDLVAMTTRLLDEAGTLGPPELRTLDAIHLAAARTAPALRGPCHIRPPACGGRRSVGITVAIPQ